MAEKASATRLIRVYRAERQRRVRPLPRRGEIKLKIAHIVVRSIASALLRALSPLPALNQKWTWQNCKVSFCSRFSSLCNLFIRKRQYGRGLSSLCSIGVSELHEWPCGLLFSFLVPGSCVAPLACCSALSSLLGRSPSDTDSLSELSLSELSTQTRLFDGFIVIPTILLIHAPSKREFPDDVDPPISSAFDELLDDVPVKNVEAALHAVTISFFACFSWVQRTKIYEIQYVSILQSNFIWTVLPMDKATATVSHNGTNSFA